MSTVDAEYALKPTHSRSAFQEIISGDGAGASDTSSRLCAHNLVPSAPPPTAPPPQTALLRVLATNPNTVQTREVRSTRRAPFYEGEVRHESDLLARLCTCTRLLIVSWCCLFRGWCGLFRGWCGLLLRVDVILVSGIFLRFAGFFLLYNHIEALIEKVVVLILELPRGE